MLNRLPILVLALSLVLGMTAPAFALTTAQVQPTTNFPTREQQIKTIRPTQDTGVKPVLTDVERKLLLQDQEKQRWLKYADQLNKEASRSSGMGEPKCANVDATLKARSTALDKNYVKAANSYKQADQRATNTVRLARQYLGDDAAAAEGMLLLFHEKIALFESQSKTFDAQQREALLYACRNSQGKFGTELSKLKQTGTMNGKSMKDIVTYYEQTFRPELVRLTEKLKAIVPRPTPQTDSTQKFRQIQDRPIQQRAQ